MKKVYNALVILSLFFMVGKMCAMYEEDTPILISEHTVHKFDSVQLLDDVHTNDYQGFLQHFSDADRKMYSEFKIYLDEQFKEKVKEVEDDFCLNHCLWPMALSPYGAALGAMGYSFFEGLSFSEMIFPALFSFSVTYGVMITITGWKGRNRSDKWEKNPKHLYMKNILARMKEEERDRVWVK